MEKPIIFGERIRQARELRGLTQAELATRIGTSQAIIAQLEGELRRPSDNQVETIAIQTGFPLSFFRTEPINDFPLGSLLYRARTSMPVRHKTEVYQMGRLIYECASRVESKVSQFPLRLPRIKDQMATEAAKLTRNSLGLSPDVPIQNLVRVLERGGVLVFELPIDIGKLDAYSTWAGKNLQKPVIVLAPNKPADRLRFNVAHEVGHLVMHQSINGSLDDLEKEANQFAAEFLMPEVAMTQELYPPVTLTRAAVLKPRWGVSIQALVERAYNLQIITQRQRRYLWQQLGSNGWRTNEPINIPAERPRILSKMAELLYGSPVDYKRLAADTNLTLSYARSIFGDAQVDHDNKSIIQFANPYPIEFRRPS